MTPEPAPSRICQEAQAQLPGYVKGSLSRLRGRLVSLHLHRCEVCGVELERQRAVADGLGELGEVTAAAAEEPPEWLLGSLLDQAEKPGARGRAAVPARGAISGARPTLSVALLVAGAATGTAAGYATWRGSRALRGRLRRR